MLREGTYETVWTMRYSLHQLVQNFFQQFWADILLGTTFENAFHDDTPNKMVYEQTLSNDETLSQPKGEGK